MVRRHVYTVAILWVPLSGCARPGLTESVTSRAAASDKPRMAIAEASPTIQGGAGGATMRSNQHPNALHAPGGYGGRSIQDRDEARATAVAWLEAFATRDQASLQATSASSLKVAGFLVPLGSEALGCGKDSELSGHLDIQVDENLSLAKLVECLLESTVFSRTIPLYPAGEFPRKITNPDARRRVGYLRDLDIQEALPARLRKFRPALEAEAANGRLFGFFLSGSGTTYEGAMSVKVEAERPRVAGVFIDEENHE